MRRGPSPGPGSSPPGPGPAPRRGPVLLAGLLLICASTPTLTSAGELDEDPDFLAAQAAFAAGDLEEAEATFAALGDRYAERSEPLFWRAYVDHKQGEPERALPLARAALALDPDNLDALYLAGLLEYRGGDREAARAHFERTAELDPVGELGVSAARYVVRIQWSDDQDAVLAAITRGELSAAEQALASLQADPLDAAWLAYYQGYVAYHQGEPERALAHFDALLALDPGDEWGRYMRALALADVGGDPIWVAELEALTTSEDPEVAVEARDTLTRLQDPSPPALGETAPRPRRHPGSWRFSAGAGLDTNPAFVAESSYVPTGERSPAAETQVRGEELLWRRGPTRLYLAPTLSMRAHSGDATAYDLAQVTARVELSRSGERISGWAGVGAGISWLGWTLFLDVEELYAGAAWRQAAWTRTRLSASGYRRAPQRSDYENLRAFGTNLRLSQALEPASWITAEVGYRLQGNPRFLPSRAATAPV